jgi:dihydroflavonol-4-reductase
MNLVTGGTGHIGNVLVKELARRGEGVRVLVLPEEDLSPFNGLDIEIYQGNVLDTRSIMNAMQGIDYVFHLAGIISIMPGKNQLVHDVNVNGTSNVLSCAREAGVKKFVHTSSIHAFKRVGHGIVVNEETPIDPDNAIAAYDKSKAEATLAVLEVAKEGFPAVIVCPTGVIGPYDFKGSELGVLFHGWMKNKVNFLIDGEYDFVDVRDVVNGMILARDKGVPGQIYILSGELLKVSDVWKIVKALLPFKSSSINIPTQLALFLAKIAQVFYQITRTKPRFTTYSIETLHSNANISNHKARTILGYNPRSMKESIKDTIGWWRQRSQKVKQK